MNIHQQKEQLRQQLLSRRQAISEKEYQQASETIVDKLFQQPEFQQAHVIHSYVSMNGRREVDTHRLIKKMISGQKKVVVPVTHFNEGVLTHIKLDSFDVLEKNQWGVLEPDGGIGIAAKEIELVVVPLVGADEQCNRIGYGEGFYDRFLKDVTCPKIGLLFEQNVTRAIPTEEFDVPLDKVITEYRVIQRD